MEQAGGSSDYNYFRGSVYQKGYGLGGSFKRFFKWIIPIFKQHALPKIEIGLKQVGSEALSPQLILLKMLLQAKILV